MRGAPKPKPKPKVRPRGEAKQSELTGLLFCSFCSRHRSEVGPMVSGPSVYICGGCVDIAQSVLDEYKGKPK
ncbi:MAG: ClpX C4-type zinc finger protein [Pontibacterium sp.]